MKIEYAGSWPFGSCAATEIMLHITKECKDRKTKIKEHIEKAFSANKGRLIVVTFNTSLSETPKTFLKTLLKEIKNEEFGELYIANYSPEIYKITCFALLNSEGKMSDILFNTKTFKEEYQNYVVQP